MNTWPGLSAWICSICIFLSLSACAGGISTQSRSQITYSGPFDDVQQQPEKYRGETVMWGGKVIDTMPGEKSTELVVLQLGLGGQNRPQDNDLSRGRFIVRSDRLLDPAAYPKGTLVTVVGPLKGAEIRPIGRMDYQYPVMGVIEILIWQQSTNSYPRFYFGVGVGAHF